MKELTDRLGFYASLVAFVAATGFCIAQLLQVLGDVAYPLDAVLIYGFSLGIALPFLLAILALHYSVSKGNNLWTHAALIFAVMYNIYVILMYTIQLAVVIPASL